jgi:hypothetical protein
MTVDPNAKQAVLQVPGPAVFAVGSQFPLWISFTSPHDVKAQIPVNFFSNAIDVSGRVTNQETGLTVAWFDQTISAATPEVLEKTVNLPSGLYSLAVTIKDSKTGMIYSGSTAVAVK